MSDAPHVAEVHACAQEWSKVYCLTNKWPFDNLQEANYLQNKLHAEKNTTLLYTISANEHTDNQIHYTDIYADTESGQAGWLVMKCRARMTAHRTFKRDALSAEQPV